MEKEAIRLGPLLLGLGFYFQGIPPSWDFIYNAIEYRIADEKSRKLVKELADFLREKGIDSSWALEIIEFFIFRIPSFCLDIAKDTVKDLVNKGVRPKVIVDFLNNVMAEYRKWIRQMRGRELPPTPEIRFLFLRLVGKTYKELIER